MNGLCSSCGRKTPGYETTNLGSPSAGYRDLCLACFNKDTAEYCGVEGFQHVDFQPMTLRDCDGKTHTFHFTLRLSGTHQTLAGFEVQKGQPFGYRFQLSGEPDGDPMLLMAELIRKIRRGLSVRHVRPDGTYGPQITEGQKVEGWIGWDDEQQGRVPELIIDGRSYTWEQVGRMMMTFEGWQFRLQIQDPSDTWEEIP